jgi:hypothetical protein
MRTLSGWARAQRKMMVGARGCVLLFFVFFLLLRRCVDERSSDSVVPKSLEGLRVADDG